MDIQAYISSGVLEAYAMGALDAAEHAEVIAMLEKYPELREEVAAIENGLWNNAQLNAIVPPTHLENNIWDAINNTTTSNTVAQEATTANKTIPLTTGKKSFNWAYAAGWVGLVGSLAFNAMQWQKSQAQQNLYAQLEQKMAQLNQEQVAMSKELQDYKKNKEMMADTGMQTIVMHTVQKGHPMAATVYWSKENGQAYVTVDGLPEAPDGMQYQLWVIIDGKPVDMGTIPQNMPNTPTIEKVNKSVVNGQAFAISLEKAGGSPTPTMDKIFVMGKPS